MTTDRLPIVVLVSGSGSNLRAIAERARTGALPVDIRCVLSDRAAAPGLAWAAAAGIPTEAIAVADHTDRAAFDRALAERIDAHAPALVVLAGFMRILGREFVDRYAGRMLNVHPSLLPRHRGLHTHRRVLEAGDAEHGASVHFVTPELDGGPVVVQARVPVLPGDDEAKLAARVLAQEHCIYPECIGWYATGRLRLVGERPVLDGRVLETPLLREASHAAA
ncbi:MAG: phosphoribosylglycinamide formyltransferase [Lysobacterales bacterium]|jgi:phosphoribosylglycinamide formyltransferase-1|nr:MAG: phosphoribosylglycinamide formyltransferase [Xanthomonadales bacterium]